MILKSQTEANKEYRQSDYRVKCSCCRRWMRSGDATEKTPAKRRPAPHAGRCTECPANHYGCGCPEQNNDWEDRQRIDQEHRPRCPGRAT